MAKKSAQVINYVDQAKSKEPKSLAYFEGGIDTDLALVNACLALAGDVIAQRLAAPLGNTVNGNVRNMLKLVELKYKYGAVNRDGGPKVLQLK